MFVIIDDETNKVLGYMQEREDAEMVTFAPAIIEAAQAVVEDARAVIAWQSIDRLEEELGKLKIGGGS